jgi:hypothetical protein
LVVAGVVLGGLVAMPGCGTEEDALDDGDDVTASDGLRFHRHRRDAGGTPGTTGGGTGGVTGVTGGATAGTNGGGAGDDGVAASCEVCTKASECCAVVSDGICSFSAATCAAMAPVARNAYVESCLVSLNTTKTAWKGAPPAECR